MTAEGLSQPVSRRVRARRWWRAFRATLLYAWITVAVLMAAMVAVGLLAVGTSR